MKQLIHHKKINSQIILSSGKMKIDKEKFNSLKQMDRIEYRQKFNGINERYDVPLNFGFYFALLVVGLLVMIIGLNVFEISLFNIDGGVNEGIEEGYKIMESLVHAALIIFVLGIFIVFIDIIFSIIYLILKHKKLSELEEEYFSVEVKK